jgi:hypothetical protein
VVRYNKWRDAFVGNGGTALVAITFADGLQFYGNVAWNFQVGDAAVGFAGYSSSHNRIYNNTFVGAVGYNAGTAFGSGTDNVVRNNLFVNCGLVSLAGTHDFNAFSDGNSRDEANAQINVPTSLGFRLSSETTPGASVVAPFDTDMLGVIRGTDGVVSRGAFEFAAH